MNFISIRSNDEECVLHSKSDNLEILINNKVDKVIEKLFQSFLFKYQNELEKSMKAAYSFFIVFIYHITNSKK